MKPVDISAGLRLCREANWNQIERDWQMFVKPGTGTGSVAVDGEKVVGTVSTVRYGQSFSWIGMVLVDKANRRQGIGVRLLEEALHILKDEETAKLDATPAGREIYLKLGFKDEYQLSRMNAVVDRNKLTPSTAKPLLRNDLPAVINFDHTIFGGDRKKILEWAFKGAPQFAFVEKEGSEVLGFCLGRHGYSFTQFGPVVAKDLATAKSLINAALNNCVGCPVIIDALLFEPAWIGWLAEIGFEQQRTLTRMYRGLNRFPGTQGHQYAILGPEFG